MTPAQKQLLASLARVDWLSVGQRVAVFCRSIRGDSAEQIHMDHARSVERATKLRGSIESAAEQVLNQQHRGR